ncbi:MAG: TauD/TfdA family dioxygenase [Acidimicrobiales bacterium]|jgi:taurine dioxygenase|nr:TauD/TfdA family dioxygenase [Acidimicrobiales bacterium]
MSLEITQLNGFFGAEVGGVDMAKVDDATTEELRKAWLDHKVLVLRDQHVSIKDHITFGRLFGDLEEHPFTEGIEGYPEIVRLEAGGDTDKRFVASQWHSDVTWRAEPSMGSILRGRIIPEIGGDTCFSDATAAYARLPDELKEEIDDLFAIHDYARVFADRVDPAEVEEVRAKYPLQRHPVIRTHPDTGARGIYTNRAFVSHIDGVEQDDSERILRRMEKAMMDPSVQIRVRWEPDTFVMWDNRAVQHAATSDFFPAHRVMERVTVIGDRPF